MKFKEALVIALLLAAGISLGARAQVKTLKGTVVVIYNSPSEVVVSADSRETRGDGSYHDDGCKISLFGNRTIFASSGVRHFEARGLGRDNKPIQFAWDSHKAAATAFHRAGNQAILSMARLWLDSAEQTFTIILKNDPNSIDNLLVHEFYAAEGVFVAKDGRRGSVAVAHAYLRVDHSYSPMKGNVEPVTQNSTMAMGSASVVREFLQGPSGRAIR